MSVSEKLNKFIAENGGNARDALNVALARLELSDARLESIESEIENVYIEDHILGCGIEDRNITNRYEAGRYGFDLAYEKVMDCIHAQ